MWLLGRQLPWPQAMKRQTDYVLCGKSEKEVAPSPPPLPSLPFFLLFLLIFFLLFLLLLLSLHAPFLLFLSMFFLLPVLHLFLLILFLLALFLLPLLLLPLFQPIFFLLLLLRCSRPLTPLSSPYTAPLLLHPFIQRGKSTQYKYKICKL